MLNREELRIGNIISAATDEDENPIPCKVLELFTNECRWTTALKGPIFGDGNDTSYDYIEGIPLTEEWILRLGFEYANDPGFDKHADAKVYYKGSLQIGIREETNKKIWRHVVYFYGYPVTTDSALFVHSVQNLAFALMREELIIK